MSTDLHMLSGAYALHALTPEEEAEFHEHLEACEPCREEVSELQQAAAQMGAAQAVAPPPELKARVLAAAEQVPQMPPEVRRQQRGDGGGSGRNRWAPRLLAAAAAVVLVVAGGVAVNELTQDDEGEQLAAGVVRVFNAEDAHTATMETRNGGRIAVATSPSLNEMAVDTDELPPLDNEHDYQLWAVVDGQMQPVLVLEPEKGAAMEMPEPDVEVAITIEPVGGSDEPTTEPIMQVTPSEV